MEIKEAGILNKSICHLTMERKKEGRAKKCIIEAMNLSTSILPAIGQFLDDISQEDNVTDMIQKELSVSCVTDNIAFVKSIYNRIVSNLYFSNIVTTGCVTTI